MIRHLFVFAALRTHQRQVDAHRRIRVETNRPFPIQRRQTKAGDLAVGGAVVVEVPFAVAQMLTDTGIGDVVVAQAQIHKEVLTAGVEQPVTACACGGGSVGTVVIDADHLHRCEAARLNHIQADVGQPVVQLNRARILLCRRTVETACLHDPALADQLAGAHNGRLGLEFHIFHHRHLAEGDLRRFDALLATTGKADNAVAGVEATVLGPEVALHLQFVIPGGSVQGAAFQHQLTGNVELRSQRDAACLLIQSCQYALTTAGGCPPGQGRHLRRRKRPVVDPHLVDIPLEEAFRACAASADGPVAVDRYRTDRPNADCDLYAVAVELPEGAVVDAHQVDPVIQVTGWDIRGDEMVGAIPRQHFITAVVDTQRHLGVGAEVMAVGHDVADAVGGSRPNPGSDSDTTAEVQHPRVAQRHTVVEAVERERLPTGG